MTTTTTNKAVIFDMDGVLVDNHAYHVKAWREFCQRHQRSLQEEEFSEHINGRSVWEAIRYLFGKELSEQEVRALGDEKEELYRELYKPHLQPTPGLESFLQKLQKAGWQLALATSAPPVNMHFTLEALGVTSYFPITVDGSGVDKAKPAPDLYLKAADVLELPPNRCIVFEDSKAGITSAREAGMPVIALSTTHSRKELEPTGVRLIIESFNDLDLTQLDDILHERSS